MSPTVWHWPAPWLVLAPLGSVLAVFLAYVVLARLVDPDSTQPPRQRFFALWFAAVAAGAVATLPWAAGMIAADFPPPRKAFFFNAAGDSVLLSAYWGLIWGWLPALVAVRAGDRALRIRSGLGVVTSALLVPALILAGAGFFLGSRALETENAAASALASGHTIGALPDPHTEVTPPPEVAPGDHEIDPAWCGPDQSALLLGGEDGATGHRVLSIELMNFSDRPCALAGYPDIAFADQNGSELDVTLIQGSSSLADDPGPAEIVVPAGGKAITHLGWDAMATHGKVAYAVHAAPYPGVERGSWPVTLDIAEGGEVAVTAWQLSGARR